jgi:hypothetical protein
LGTVTSVIPSAQQHHRSIVQADKAVLRNFPEKVEILKNNPKLTKENRAARSSQLQKAFPLSGVSRPSILQSPADCSTVRARQIYESIRQRKSAQLTTGIPDFFVSTRVRFLIQTPHENNLRPNEKKSASL